MTDLTPPAEVEFRAYAGMAPWHRLGKQLGGLASGKQMVAEADLGWSVVKVPLYFKMPEGLSKLTQYALIQNEYATVRTDSWDQLGIVGPAYTVLQNADAFAMMDDIINDSTAKYEAAGSLRGGRKVWAMARLPEDVMVRGMDAVRPYLLIVNSHDGSSCLTLHVTMVRVVCMNTLVLAVRAAKRSMVIRHTSGLPFRTHEAREILGVSFKYLDQFKRLAEDMVSSVVSPDDTQVILAEVLPGDSYRVKNWRDEITSILDNERNRAFKGTRWGIYNAIVEWFDYHKGGQKNLENEVDILFERTVLDLSKFKESASKIILRDIVP